MNTYKQQTTYDCMLACLAMVVQKPIEDLFPSDFRAEVEEAEGTYGDNIDRAFELAGLRKNVDYWTTYIPDQWATNPSLRRLLSGRRACLQVPSLNHKGAQHLVYWHGDTLHDPSNKQVYRWIEQCHPAFVYVFNEVVGLPSDVPSHAKDTE